MQTPPEPEKRAVRILLECFLAFGMRSFPSSEIYHVNSFHFNVFFWSVLFCPNIQHFSELDGLLTDPSLNSLFTETTTIHETMEAIR